jgi:hypothetical protein
MSESKTAASRTTSTGATAVLAIGPHQVHHLDDDSDRVTVTYPAGASTVLSVQPDGTLETRPAGSAGPYETALLKVDRLVYAPIGDAGPVYLLPYSDEIPNV